MYPSTKHKPWHGSGQSTTWKTNPLPRLPALRTLLSLVKCRTTVASEGTHPSRFASPQHQFPFALRLGFSFPTSFECSMAFDWHVHRGAHVLLLLSDAFFTRHKGVYVAIVRTSNRIEPMLPQPMPNQSYHNLMQHVHFTSFRPSIVIPLCTTCIHKYSTVRCHVGLISHVASPPRPVPHLIVIPSSQPRDPMASSFTHQVGRCVRLKT